MAPGMVTVSTVNLSLTEGVSLQFTSGETAPETATLWSGAQAFRTRWRSDMTSTSWNVSGCMGTHEDDDGDAFRFDAATRTLREVHLNRPAKFAIAPAVFERLCALPQQAGVVVLGVGFERFVVPTTKVALFDASLSTYIALRNGSLETLNEESSLQAFALSDHVSLLCNHHAVIGWRVVDPVMCARPLGWTDIRSTGESDEASNTWLTQILYDWMVIDASDRPSPESVSDPEEIEHMVALRQRARALAETAQGPDDAVASVAQDIAVHIHWSWGFYKVGE
jgi:hypothetical protein